MTDSMQITTQKKLAMTDSMQIATQKKLAMTDSMQITTQKRFAMTGSKTDRHAKEVRDDGIKDRSPRNRGSR